MGLKPKFFKIPPEQFVDGKATIISTTKTIIETVADDDGNETQVDTGMFASMTLEGSLRHTFEDGDVLVSALLKRHNIAQAQIVMVNSIETMPGVVELGIDTVYKGMDYGAEPYVGLFWFHPELDGTKTIDDGEGGTIEVPIIQPHTWGATDPTL